MKTTMYDDDSEDDRSIIRHALLFGLLLLFVGAGLQCGTPAPVHGQDARQIEWTDSTRLALAQCLVAESGPQTRSEHSAMAHLLERRWRLAVQHNPTYGDFEHMVRRYCHLHRDQHHVTARMMWIRALPWGVVVEDPHAASVDWTRPAARQRFNAQWSYARETVEMFERGELRDPLPLAMHFGGNMDSVCSAAQGCVWLGPTAPNIARRDGESERVTLRNHFYSVNTVVQRAYERAQTRLRRTIEDGVVVIHAE